MLSLQRWCEEGNGNPLQCSCLKNPRDRGAWWAAFCLVAQNWTQWKQLSSSSSRNNRHRLPHPLHNTGICAIISGDSSIPKADSLSKSLGSWGGGLKKKDFRSLLFLKDHQNKVILRLKRLVLGQQILLTYNITGKVGMLYFIW